ncbi:hypothetical protein K4F52_010204 [Lecanicillium sp. MT-2017a]|nr:hypothetical protein K4F52_010204 [Lecanicillium sp. MT-2017a]
MSLEPSGRPPLVQMDGLITPLSLAFRLGRLFGHQGKGSLAEDIYRDALQDFRRSAADDFSSASAVLREVLVMLNETNELGQAKEYYQPVIDNFRATLGPLHWATLSIVLETGIFLMKHGQLTQSQHLYESFVELSERNVKSNNSAVFDVLHELVSVYIAQNKLSNAEAIYEIALNALLRLNGPNHPLTQQAILNLGGCYRDQGKLHDAAVMYWRAASSLGSTVGIADSTSIAVFNQLTAIHIKTRDLPAAESSCLSAVIGTGALYGSNHERTLLTKLDLGVLYRDQMKLVEAKTTFSGLILEFRSLVHSSEAIALNYLGTVNLMEGNLEEAEENFEAALDGFRNLETDAPMLVFSTLYNLGVLFEAQAKEVEAENSYQKAFQGFRDIGGQRHISTLTAADSLGDLYMRQKRFADAEYLLSEALRDCKDEGERSSVEDVRKDANLTLIFQRMTVSHFYGQICLVAGEQPRE